MNGFGVEPRIGSGDVTGVVGIGRRGMDLDERPLEALSDWLAAGSVDGVSTTYEGHVVPASRVTLNRIHDLADDTELRARTLAWMIEARGFTDQSARKVEGLFRVATELRQMAERLLTLEGGTPQQPFQPSFGDVGLTRDCDTIG